MRSGELCKMGPKSGALGPFPQGPEGPQGLYIRAPGALKVGPIALILVLKSLHYGPPGPLSHSEKHFSTPVERTFFECL